MNPTWTFICLLVAFVLFVLAALNVTVQRVNLVAAGLALWLLPALWLAGKAL
jgi:hypothetical protein